jgi:hypothetical protein
MEIRLLRGTSFTFVRPGLDPVQQSRVQDSGNLP